MTNKKKPVETLRNFDKLLDTVLNILAKLALVSMSIRTIVEIWTR